MIAALILQLSTGQSFPCEPTRIADGDTFRCAGIPQRIRLKDIDAPELPGHCRRGRHCAPGDPYAAKAALSRILASGAVRCQHRGFDRYQRILATCRVNGRDVGSLLIADGFARAWR